MVASSTRSASNSLKTAAEKTTTATPPNSIPAGKSAIKPSKAAAAKRRAPTKAELIAQAKEREEKEAAMAATIARLQGASSGFTTSILAF